MSPVKRAARGRSHEYRLPLCTVLIGPPTAGKSTWVKEHAQPGDLIVDLDLLVAALSTEIDGHVKPSVVVTKAAMDARRSAMKIALRNLGPEHAYVVHAMPTVQELYQYQQYYRAKVEVLDPGREVVEQRLATLPARYLPGAMKWYDLMLPAYQAARLL